MRTVFIKSTLIGVCLSLPHFALADQAANTAKHTLFPTTPGFTAEAMSDNGNMEYEADAMIPIVGQRTQFFHLTPQVFLQNKSNYTASIGAGIRSLTESSGIFGAYLFGDYNHSHNGNSFLFVNPGVERLGKLVDLVVNLYVPVSAQRIDINSGVTQINGYNKFESVGPGGDLQIGVHPHIFTNPKIHVGGYYFSPKDTNQRVQGVFTRFEIPITNQFTLLVSDAYDKVKRNVFKFGLSVSLGGRTSGKYSSGDLAERMVEPINRNFATVVGPYHTAEPIIDTVH